MNYQRIYNELIQRGVDRGTVDGYSEKHHIIPRSLGGSDDKSNLVVLTAREHFIAHWLLYRIYKNTEYSHGLSYAWEKMTLSNKSQCRMFSSRSFEYARITRAREQSKFMKGRTSGADNPTYNDDVVRLYNIDNGDVVEGTRLSIAEQVDLTNVDVCNLTYETTTTKHIKGWCLWEYGTDEPTIKRKRRSRGVPITIQHDTTGRVEHGSPNDLMDKLGLGHSFRNLVCGRIKSYKKWRIV